MSVKSTLPEPEKHTSIPANSQWLSGEGAGSWFSIKKENEKFYVSRYSPEGKVECEGEFVCKNEHQFSIEMKYQFVHLSHCKTVHIVQESSTFIFERV